MPRRSYVTTMPDKTGAFLTASKIIAKHGGNIVRVSYNKAVDLHTLFIDVEASEEDLALIAGELTSVGYLHNKISEVNVIVVEIRIPDRPGTVLPVLKILDRYDINISYINSNADGSPEQRFKMGLLIEDPAIIKMLLDEVSELYPIDIIDYADSETNLDNTIFYIRMANEMQKLLGLSTETTMEFISEANRILQVLQEQDEDPDKVFHTIRRFATFVGQHRNGDFKTDVETVPITEKVTLTSIQPPCGSNTYVLDSGDELVLIDTGYAIYAEEMFAVFDRMFADWRDRLKRVFVTHADVDHCGLLAKLPDVPILLNRKSAESLTRQLKGAPDYRESRDFGLGYSYSKLSRIISGYSPPEEERFVSIDEDTPDHHDDLRIIGSFQVGDLTFEVHEGSGGHIEGEMVFVCRESGLVFTGDILVNISGFSPERAEFNSLAPYLMRSVNMNSEKATTMRRDVVRLIEAMQQSLQKPCLVCGGHGPLSIWRNGRLESAETSFDIRRGE